MAESTLLESDPVRDKLFSKQLQRPLCLTLHLALLVRFELTPKGLEDLHASITPQQHLVILEGVEPTLGWF